MKPVSEARFAATMKRLGKRLSQSKQATRDERIIVTTSRGATVLHLSEIDWIEAAGNYAQLWIGQRNYFLRESLQLLEERAGKHGFIRAHRRALVRLDGVRELTRTWPAARSSRLPHIRRLHPNLRRRAAGFTAAFREICGIVNAAKSLAL